MLKGLRPPPDSTCRLCNRIGRKKKLILFKDWRDEKTNLKIEHLLGIRLLYHFRLSNSVCEECLDKLNYLDAFAKCAVANQELFAELIKDTHYHYKGKPNVPTTKTPKPNEQPISELSVRPISQPTVRPINQLSKIPINQPVGKPPPVPTIKTCSYTVFTSNHKIGNKGSDSCPENMTAKKVYVKKKEERKLYSPFVKSPFVMDSELLSATKRASVKTETEEEIDITSDGDDDTVSTNECPSIAVNTLPPQLQNKSSMLEITSVRSCTNEDHANCSHREREEFHATEADSNDSDDCVVIENESSPKKLKLSKPEDRINTKIQLKPPTVKVPVSQSSSEATIVNIKQEGVDLDCVEEIIDPALIQGENEFRDPDLIEQNLWSKVVTCPTRQSEHNVRISLSCFKCKTSNPSYLFLLYHLMNKCSCKVTSNPASLVLSSSALKKQCSKIDISEATLLHKVDKEIEMCFKNKATLRTDVLKISKLTKLALVNYRKEEEIKLQKDISCKQPANSEKCNVVSKSSVAPQDKEIEVCLENGANLREDVSREVSELKKRVIVIEEETKLQQDISSNNGKSNDVSESSVAPQDKEIETSLENRANLREEVEEVSELVVPALVNCGKEEETKSQDSDSHEQSANDEKSNDFSRSNDAPPTSITSTDDTPLLDCEVTCEDSEEDSSEEK